MNFLIQLIVAILQAVVPKLVKAAKDTSQDGVIDKDKRDLARKKVMKRWAGVKLPILFFLVFTTGCFTDTIYVPDGAPVRLRETIKDAKVWVLNADGKPVPGEMDLLEGWYALSIKDEDKDD